MTTNTSHRQPLGQKLFYYVCLSSFFCLQTFYEITIVLRYSAILSRVKRKMLHFSCCPVNKLSASLTYGIISRRFGCRLSSRPQIYCCEFV